MTLAIDSPLGRRCISLVLIYGFVFGRSVLLFFKINFQLPFVAIFIENILKFVFEDPVHF